MSKRRKHPNGKTTTRARPVVLPWEVDGMASIGVSYARWAVLHGLAVLCGPITSPEVVAATGWSTRIAGVELQWAAGAGWLRREQNPEWDQWVPQHANGAKPKWRYWPAGPVERQKPDPTRRGRAPGPRGPKGRKIVAQSPQDAREGVPGRQG